MTALSTRFTLYAFTIKSVSIKEQAWLLNSGLCTAIQKEGDDVND